ncbi:3-hydroxybutyryl-CoA dehydrogenase [candidate division KSB1 bacterium]|nr:MAG: 3-hydroxybutyryl-CoA dehydrogenase [candidate division KSB1 bacterium]MCE7944754.1 3-hydroxybutyryl-CoA dehydrogenase [Chlorobi bacterium CHB1]MDL1876739.1 3-hydroxybutyryl-CoA dehydrogenase [Cytophagia bacterium CHB2]
MKTVGIVGCGLMGSGIAQISAQAGYKTIVREVNDELLKKGLGKIEDFLSKGVAKGKVTEEQKKSVLANLSGTTRLADLKYADIVIEAAIENIALKKELFGELDRLCPEQTIFASNTSSLTITEMAAATKRPDRFVGLHFFNPVPLMKLVEVVRTIATSQATFDAAFAFAKTLGKEPIACKDNSGFVVNLLLVPYLLDAIRAVENGVASIEDIDKGMMLGCGYPMGPLTLLDFVGLDTTYYIANIMFDEYREAKYAPPPLLRKMVLAGLLGKKTGKGFYDYSGEKPKATDLGL